MPTFYLDPAAGNDTNNGTTWALAWKTITSGATAARIAPGDTIRIAKSPDPASIGTATWTDASETVVLDTAQTMTVDNCETAWTPSASTDVTVARTAVATAGREGAYSMKLTFDAAVQTNKMEAYYTLPAELNLSGYQELSFWLHNVYGLTAAGRVTISLCSDTAGATPVDVFPLPLPAATAKWYSYNVARNGGGNLGASIKSISISTTGTAPASSTAIYLDGIIATKTNGLNYESLISLSSIATQDITAEQWYSPLNIDGVNVKLSRSSSVTTLATSAYCKWYKKTGGTTNATTYMRRTYSVPASSESGNAGLINDSGTAGNQITFSGGWNTSNSTQDGMTWFDGTGAYFGYGINIDTRNYITINGIGLSRYNKGLSATTAGYGIGMDITLSLTNVGDNQVGGSSANLLTNSTLNMAINGSSVSFGGINLVVTAYNVYSTGFSMYGRLNTANLFNMGLLSNAYFISMVDSKIIADVYKTGLTWNNNPQNVMICDSTFASATPNAVRGLAGAGCVVVDSTSTGSATSAFEVTGKGNYRVINHTSSGETLTTVGTANADLYSYLKFERLGGDADDNRIYSNYANALSQKTTVHTASGIAWQVNITNAAQDSTNPHKLPIAKVACSANTQVSISAWVKKSHASDVAARLSVPNYQLTSHTADPVSSTKANDTDWEQLTVTFTPTLKGVYEVMLDSWWVANTADESVYVDDITIVES